MLTGLFMSTFLIGSLWFLMGIGDAIVFRNRMQEATDHATFSSAALHAKGMNFIAMCNLVMLVGTVIHLILGIFADIKLVLMIACIKTLPWCAPALPGRIKGYWSAYKRWTNYFGKMNKNFTAIHRAQKVAAYAYPAMSVIQGGLIGAKYEKDNRRTGDVYVATLSLSLVPGGGVNGTNGQSGATGTLPPGFEIPDENASEDDFKKIDWDNFDMSKITVSTPDLGTGKKNPGTGKEGLPVQANRMSFLCDKVMKSGVNAGLNLFGLANVGGIGGKALKYFKKLLALGVKLRYCNNIHVNLPPLGPGWHKFWDDDGPYVMWGGAHNGNSYMRVWGLNFGSKLYDENESKVAMANGKIIVPKYTKEESGGKLGKLGLGPLGGIGIPGTPIATPTGIQIPGSYFSTAEFYYDCDRSWGNYECNMDDGAMFSIKWRARLIRFNVVDIYQDLVGAGLSALLQLPQITQFKNIKIPDWVIKKVSGYYSQQMLNAFLNGIIGEIEGWIEGKGKGLLLGQVPKGPQPVGIFH
jgi:hypothetical protein